MQNIKVDRSQICKLIDLALAEDLSDQGDITSKNSIDPQKSVDFFVNTRQKLVSCTEPIADIMFKNFDIDYQIIKKDGELVDANQTIIAGRCKALDILQIERVFLNFIQSTCGVSTITNQFVQKIKGTNAIIRDTRKTTPGMRSLQRYAVSVGGGQSYRMSLSDKILIKDNHIASCGGIINAINRIRSSIGQDCYIAIECDNDAQVKDSAKMCVDMILLDNMSPTQLAYCVEWAKSLYPQIKLEASGGVSLQNVEEIAKTGVDYISVGMITHSAPSKDIGIDIKDNADC